MKGEERRDRSGEFRENGNVETDKGEENMARKGNRVTSEEIRGKGRKEEVEEKRRLGRKKEDVKSV